MRSLGNTKWTAQFGMDGADVEDAGNTTTEMYAEPQQSNGPQTRPFPKVSASDSTLSPPYSEREETTRKLLMSGSDGVGVIAFLSQHDTTMREQLQLQKEIVLRLKQQQRDLSAWQERLERWENDLSRRDRTRLQSGDYEDRDYRTSPVVAETPAGRARTASIVSSMDRSQSGYVTWDQFLAYIRWQERHFGTVLPAAEGSERLSRESDLLLSSPTRRASMMQRNKETMHQVRTRIDLRKVFDSLCPEASDGRVSCDELIYAIRFSQGARDLFLPSLLAKTLPAYSFDEEGLGLATPNASRTESKYWL